MAVTMSLWPGSLAQYVIMSSIAATSRLMSYPQLPHPAEKRSAAIAIINTMANLAQIYSPYFYLPENGPQYLGAMVANVFFCIACIGFTFVLRHYLKKENTKLERRENLEEIDDAREQEHKFRFVL